MEKVRVFRILKYEGTREWVEKTLAHSIQGCKTYGESYEITNKIEAQTIEAFPIIIETEEETK